MALAPLAHARRGRRAGVRLVQRRHDFAAVSLEPAPRVDDAHDERDEYRRDQAHAPDIAHEPRQVAAEHVADRTERDDPHDAARRVVDRERAQRHPDDPREDAGEAAHERDESPEEDRLAAVSREHRFGARHPLRREHDPLAVPVDERPALSHAEPVARVTAGDRSDAPRDDDGEDRKRSPPRESGRRHERRFPGRRHAGRLQKEKHGDHHEAVVRDPLGDDVEHRSGTKSGWVDTRARTVET